jgi:hypothetical protein
MDRSWLRFALLYLGMIGMFLGVAGFLTFRDTDYGYTYKYSTDEAPTDEGYEVTVYSVLSEEEKRVVDQARERGQVKRDTDDVVPPDVVRKNGTYHVYNSFEYFDWLNPSTGGPALLGLGGLGAMVFAAYRDLG